MGNSFTSSPLVSPANICSTDVNCGPSVDMWIIIVCFMEPPCDCNWLLEGGTSRRPVSLVVMYVGSRRWCLGWRRQQTQNDSTNIQHSRRRRNVVFVLSLFYPLAINTFMLDQSIPVFFLLLQEHYWPMQCNNHTAI